MRLRGRSVPTAVWVWGFAVYSYVTTVVCAAWFIRHGAPPDRPVGLWRSLAWEATAYGLWIPAAAAVWLIIRRFGVGAGAMASLVGAAAVFTVFEAFATTGVGLVFAGRPLDLEIWAGRALSHAPVALLLFTAVAMVGLTAAHHARGRQAREEADRLAQALAAARAALEADDPSRSQARERLWVMAGSRRISLDPAEVEWFAAAGNYVVAHWQDREGLVRATLTAMEARLDPAVFARSHRSTLVNLARVVETRALSDGSWRLTMAGGAELVASRTYRDEILRRLER